MPATTDRLNPFRIQFQEIYRRHLCRHGQFGINVLHLIAVAGIYISLFGIIDWLVNRTVGHVDHPAAVLLMLTLPWFLVVCRNVPWKVAIGTGIFVTALAFFWSVVPAPSAWVWMLTILVMHRFQLWSHALYPMHRDMTEFNDAYPKSFRLFFLLLVYELPILLNYLVFRHEDWMFGRWTEPSATTGEGDLNCQTNAPFDANVHPG